MFGDELQRLLTDIVLPIKNMGLTVGEMMTLRMIMFWNPGPIGLTHQGIQTAQDVSIGTISDRMKEIGS